MSDVLTLLREIKVIPVLVIDDPAGAVPLVGALAEGGLACAEITFRTAAAAEGLRRVTAEYPEVLVGAGTVLSPSQAAEARAAGARFIVSPGTNQRVVDYCLAHELPIFPGICTPTELEAVLEKGIRVVKFFPSEPLGGLAFLRALAGPYRTVEFLPTGGVNLDNLASYLSFEKVLACGGSWMAPAPWIRAKQFERVREEAERTAAVVRSLARRP